MLNINVPKKENYKSHNFTNFSKNYSRIKEQNEKSKLYCSNKTTSSQKKQNADTTADETINIKFQKSDKSRPANANNDSPSNKKLQQKKLSKKSIKLKVLEISVNLLSHLFHLIRINFKKNILIAKSQNHMTQLQIQSIPYLVLARAFEKLSSTTKRSDKIDIISCLFRSVMLARPKELLPVVCLTCNQLAATYKGVELGVGDQTLLKSLSESTGRSLEDVKSDYIKLGDLGDVAATIQSGHLSSSRVLTVKQVYSTLLEIATWEGKQSRARKIACVHELFKASRETEARYIVRHLQGKLRIGFNEQSVLAALSRACALASLGKGPISTDLAWDGPIQEKFVQLESRNTVILKQALSKLPSFELLIATLVKHGIDYLADNCQLSPGFPVKLMLAQPTKGVNEILKRFKGKRFTLEFKYDGVRAQIHLLSNGQVKIFSRNTEDTTAKFPDIVNNIHKVESIKYFKLLCL
ncbi:DNA ligase 1 [Reticulomyxa filosa]|uniref:DNA ligase 1 n=1 Tax=Reticulomyxa filosa TaxID=46433 RepID=X6MY91_RETFI|nr:DNA ligase 1 [Reticulomyxa filosa]|eukprot:ETO18603.1 DNA ligase 1 [Reticulomyxa filosa]